MKGLGRKVPGRGNSMSECPEASFQLRKDSTAGTWTPRWTVEAEAPGTMEALWTVLWNQLSHSDALGSLWRRAHHCLHFRKLPRPVLEGLKRSKPRVKEAAPGILIITAESWEWKGAEWISLRDTEDLGREDMSEVSREEKGIVTLPGLLIWTAGWALVQQVLKTFKKLAPMKADFYLLAKDLEGPHPLILKGDVNTDTTLLVSEGSGIRHWFIFHSLVFLCHTF